MSHELRQPLNMISINADLLSRMAEERGTPAAQRCAEAIRTSVHSQAKIIEDLLDLSRVRTGKLTLSVAPVDAGKVVMADAVGFEQIVMNLLSNALKFTPQGGHIHVKLSSADGAMRLDVIDDGQGIAQGSMQKVWEMFGQPNSVTTRAKGGLGIGLALVRDLVHLHGGRIEVRSDGIGKGTFFSVWLPLLEQGCQDPGCTSVDEMQDMAGLLIRSLTCPVTGNTAARCGRSARTPRRSAAAS
jgi:two-component system CheB/CheR fusion protein